MAVANFFDRTVLSAAQALRGDDLAAVRGRLERQVVELAFDDAAAAAEEGRTSLDLAVRLLARTYPRLRIRALGTGTSDLAAKLEALAKTINPEVELSGAGRPTVRLVFGLTAAAKGAKTIYSGSDGWVAKVSRQGPQGCGATTLPFGAGAAACLGAANVFRAVFADGLSRADLDDAAALSLFDYTTGAAATQGPKRLRVALGETPVAGVGAIGQAVLWTLRRARGVTGMLHLVDPETVEISNLQRYVLTRQSDVGRIKVELGRETLAGSGLEVTPFVARWDQYVAGRGHARIDRVVVALDSAADRIALQASLPRRILNAWTQTGDLGVSRHDFLGDTACLACLYLPSGSAPSLDVIIARALRLPEELPILQDLRQRLVDGRPVGEDFVRSAAERLGIPAEALTPFADQPLRMFYAKAICGGHLLQLEAGRPAVEVPLAFQSAMAGVMLAADLVCDAGALRKQELAAKTVIDLTRPLGRRLNVRVLKADGAAKCLCRDRDFIAAFEAKHSAV